MKNQVLNVGQDSMLQNDLEEKMIGYKVCARSNSRAFEPATISALQSFRYRLNKETRRDESHSGPIAIFDTLQHALDFCDDNGDTRQCILLVEFVPSKERLLWKKNPPIFCRNRWGGGYHAMSGGVSIKFDHFPEGTLFAESIFPLEIIRG